MSCGADTEANLLMGQLVTNDEFKLPDIDLDSANFKIPSTNSIRDVITRVKLTDLTTGTVDGTGVFDKLMSSVKAHMKGEYDDGRIVGAEFTKAYTAMASAALNTAVQFLLGRDDAFWKAQLSQISAITASLQLETTKAEYMRMRVDALNTKATYALTKLKLATTSMDYCLSKNELEQMRPLQIATINLDNEGKTYNLEQMLPQQKLNLIAQGSLLKEQTEAARAQTMNTRTDGVTILGVLGKQKDLYTQQVTSYQRDSEVKAAKLFTDAWTVQKTVDEGLVPPNGFTNTSVDQALTKIKTENGFV